jgi:pimeloyl-ACP methyl ester carboxylesterase
MDQVEVDGLRIAYERKGEGPLIVLLHGFVGNSQEWRGQIDELSDAFTVVAWDAPGSGQSSDPPESFRMAEYADSLAGFVDALDLGRPHVIGLSFGGALALELYRRHPGIPVTLVLASAYAGWTGSLPREVVDQRLEVTLAAADLPPAEFVRALIPTMLSEAAPLEAVDILAAIMSEFHPGGFRTMARALAEANLRDVLPRVDVPTLLLYGDKDVRAPLSVAEDLLTAIPSSTLVVMEGVGHMSNVEAPERFMAEARAFLEGQSS